MSFRNLPPKPTEADKLWVEEQKDKLAVVMGLTRAQFNLLMAAVWAEAYTLKGNAVLTAQILTSGQFKRAVEHDRLGVHQLLWEACICFDDTISDKVIPFLDEHFPKG